MGMGICVLLLAGCAQPRDVNHVVAHRWTFVYPHEAGQPGLDLQGTVDWTGLRDSSASFQFNFSKDQGSDGIDQWSGRLEKIAAEENAAWENDGKARGIHIHGDTGRGDRLEPAVDAAAAIWGWGGLAINGKRLLDPVSGNENLRIEAAFVTEGVLSPTTHSFLKRDGVTPYDPNVPGDFSVWPRGRELHLTIHGESAIDNGVARDADPPSNFSWEDRVSGLSYARDFKFPTTTAITSVNVQFVVGPGAGSIRFDLLDANGALIQSRTVTAGGSDHIRLEAAQVPVGLQVIRASATNAAATFSVQAVVIPAPPLLIKLVSNNVATSP